MARRTISPILNLQTQRLLEEIDDAVASVEGSACKKGCDACCHGPFDVGAADLWLVLGGLAELPNAARRAAMQRIGIAGAEQAAVLDRMGTAGRDLDSVDDEDFDSMCDELVDQSCPFLVDGSCEIYAHRPEPCRWRGHTYTVEADGGASGAPASHALELGCPIGLNDGLNAVAFDYLDLHSRIARLERKESLPGIGLARTTIALGIRAVLKGATGLR